MAALAQNQRFLQFFWDLASLNAKIQVDAVDALLKTLEVAQGKVSSKAAENGQSPLVSNRPKGFSDELDYSLNRLLRGLSSSRDGARKGFSMALTEILATFNVVEIPYVFSKLLEFHQGGTSVSGQEARDRWLGKLFGILAIVRSNRLVPIFKGKEESAVVEFVQEVLSKMVPLLTSHLSFRKRGDMILTFPNGSLNSLDDHCFSLISELLEISTKKQFFPELCYEVLIDLISQVPKKEFFVDHIFPSLKSTLSVDPSDLLPEALSLALAIKSRFDFDVFKNLPKTPKSLSAGEILQPSNISKLVPCLHSTVSSLPKLNNVWPRAISVAIDSNPSRLSELWSIAVDGLFPSSQDKVRLGFLIAEHIASKIQPSQIEILLSKNFIQAIVRVLSSGANTKKKTKGENGDSKETAQEEPKEKTSSLVSLVVLVKKVTHALTNLSKSSGSSALAFATALQGPHGSPQFDKVTKTSTVSILLRALSPETTRSYTNELFAKFYDKEPLNASKKKSDSAPDAEATALAAEKLAEHRQLFALEQLFAISRGFVVSQKEDLIINVLEFLFFHAFYHFKGKKADKERRSLASPVSERVRATAQQKFYTLLAYLNTQQIRDENDAINTKKSSVDLGTMNDGEFWAFRVFKLQDKLESDPEVNRIAIEDEQGDDLMDIDEDEEGVREAPKDPKELRALLMEKIKSIKKEFSKLKKRLDSATDPKERKNIAARLKQNRSFALLLLLLGLQLNSYSSFLNRSIDPYSGTIVDLLEMHDKIFAANKKRDESATVKGEDEASPMEVMTSVFVHLLSQSNTIVRDTVQSAFKSFCSEMNEKSLEILIDSVAGAPDEDDDEDDLEDDEGGKGSGSESDDMEVDSNDAEATKKNHKADKEAKKADKEAKKKAKEVKRKEKGDKKEKKESSEEEVEESSEGPMKSESSMDDAAMFALDAGVEAMLSQMKIARKKKLADKVASIHYRFRILDLIEIFVRHQSENPLVFNLILPLLDCISSSGDKLTISLMAKIKTTLSKLISTKEYPRGSEVDVDGLHMILEELFARLIKPSISAEGERLVRESIFYVLKVLLGQTKEQSRHGFDVFRQAVVVKEFGSLNISKLDTLFQNTVKQFLTKHIGVSRAFFSQFIHRFPHLFWRYADTFLDNFSEARNAFLQSTVFDLLIEIMRLKTCLGNSGEQLFSRRDKILPIVKNFAEESGKAKQMKSVFLFMQFVLQTSLKFKDLKQTQALFGEFKAIASKIASKDQLSNAAAIQNLKLSVHRLLETGSAAVVKGKQKDGDKKKPKVQKGKTETKDKKDKKKKLKEKEANPKKRKREEEDSDNEIDENHKVDKMDVVAAESKPKKDKSEKKEKPKKKKHKAE